MEVLTSELTSQTAADWAAATGVATSVYSFGAHALVDPGDSFCATRCELRSAGECDPEVAHRFGCYEAERWEGQYIYYCPASLVFVATLSYEDEVPSHGLVAGPVVMGPAEDLIGDLSATMLDLIDTLPGRSPAEVGAFARIQKSLCGSLDTAAEPHLPPVAETAVGPAESVTAEMVEHYPFDVERHLVGMIRRGDRAGASELINQLLGVLYLTCEGDFPRLQQGVTELVTLFSRAAIEGGADAASIFGEKRELDRRLAGFTSFEDLSAFLVNVFHRFVGYVFDFSQFQHANALRQVVGYIRTHYAERITLAGAAREVWLSPNYLSSVFSAEMGTSFSAYVRSIRIEKSKELLRSTHLTVAEIATATGFVDQSYFTKVFTRVVGHSPTQYRRKADADG